MLLYVCDIKVSLLGMGMIKDILILVLNQLLLVVLKNKYLKKLPNYEISINKCKNYSPKNSLHRCFNDFFTFFNSITDRNYILNNNFS